MVFNLLYLKVWHPTWAWLSYTFTCFTLLVSYTVPTQFIVIFRLQNLQSPSDKSVVLMPCITACCFNPSTGPASTCRGWGGMFTPSIKRYLRQCSVQLKNLSFSFHLAHTYFAGQVHRAGREALQGKAAVEVPLWAAPHLLKGKLLQRSGKCRGVASVGETMWHTVHGLLLKKE